MTIGYIRRSRTRHGRCIAGALAILMAAFGLRFDAQASTVLEISLGDMIRDCELVFEGRVTQVEPRQDPQHDVIRTYVTFEVLDVIKGSYAASAVEISFLGGSVNDVTLRVANLSLPKTGATGIFFVESLTRQQVHPLYGWSQGYIAIASDSRGVRRVMTKDGRPIIAVDPRKQHALPPRILSTGAARGLLVEPAGRLSDAMTVETFKLALGDLLVSN